MTLGKVADIAFARGQLDEALRIRTEEEVRQIETILQDAGADPPAAIPE